VLYRCLLLFSIYFILFDPFCCILVAIGYVVVLRCVVACLLVVVFDLYLFPKI
jgi:hypothetical protein